MSLTAGPSYALVRNRVFSLCLCLTSFFLQLNPQSTQFLPFTPARAQQPQFMLVPLSSGGFIYSSGSGAAAFSDSPSPASPATPCSPLDALTCASSEYDYSYPSPSSTPTSSTPLSHPATPYSDPSSPFVPGSTSNGAAPFAPFAEGFSMPKVQVRNADALLGDRLLTACSSLLVGSPTRRLRLGGIRSRSTDRSVRSATTSARIAARMPLRRAAHPAASSLRRPKSATDWSLRSSRDRAPSYAHAWR